MAMMGRTIGFDGMHAVDDGAGTRAEIITAPGGHAKAGARLAAGWNLLETLEEMGATDLLECAAIVLEARGASAGVQDDVCRVAAAIRTALESKP